MPGSRVISFRVNVMVDKVLFETIIVGRRPFIASSGGGCRRLDPPAPSAS